MKKLGLIIILLLFSALTYSQNNAVYKRVSLDTLKSRTGTKKMYLKDTVIINNILRIPAGATDGNIAYSNANGDLIWGTLPSEADSLFVTYCCGCVMNNGWKALEDTIKIDTCYVNQIIKDSLNVHWIALNGLIQDTANIVHWEDTLVYIATKHDVDTLSNSVYDSLGNHYDLIYALDTGKVSTSGDIMYGDLTVNAKINAIDTIKAPYIKITNQYTLPTTDGTSGQGIVTDGAGTLTWGMSFDSLKCYTKLFMDSVESCLNELYLKADTITLSDKLKLQTFSSVDRPVLTVKDLSGNIDTTETIDIETTPFGFITITDSLNIGGVTYYNYGGNIIDDESITFPLNSYGFGNVYVFNAGMKVEYCRFILNIDGSFELQDNSANVQFSNVDGNVCLYSNAIQNRLGGTRYFIIELKKN